MLVSVVGAYLSFMFGGVLGLAICCGLLAFVGLEVLYHYGAKSSPMRSFKSKTASDIPDARIEATTYSPRGYYDLDYRGRGKN